MTDSTLNIEILEWARKKMDLTIEEVAEKINVARELLEEWEKGVSVPTHTQMMSLVDIYRIPLSMFYPCEIRNKSKE